MNISVFHIHLQFARNFFLRIEGYFRLHLLSERMLFIHPNADVTLAYTPGKSFLPQPIPKDTTPMIV